mmetsp:Transcript_30995/g.71423  ORF Transcript_30995/g.71423 Transcript_30995/m.71423 type:complete len:116 (+) Transcript_30995:910-1257(+)
MLVAPNHPKGPRPVPWRILRDFFVLSVCLAAATKTNTHFLETAKTGSIYCHWHCLTFMLTPIQQTIDSLLKHIVTIRKAAQEGIPAGGSHEAYYAKRRRYHNEVPEIHQSREQTT